MSINKVIISGNLTRDAELSTTAGGTAMLKIGVAVNERVRTSNGEYEDRANYVDCVLWGRRAEALAKYMAKGTKVAVVGRLHWSGWKDKETGRNRSKLDVFIEDLEFMSRAQDAQNGAQAAPSAQDAVQAQWSGASVTEAPAAYNDEDIHF